MDMRPVFALLMSILLLSLFTSSEALAKSWPQDYRAEGNVQIKAQAWPECCPRPSWWHEIEAPVIETRDDFHKIWRSKKLTKRQKAKAMYRAIEDKIGVDDEIASLSINYYRWVDPRYPHLTKLLEIGVSSYFNFNRSLEGYRGKIGDTSAGLVNSLAYRYSRVGQNKQASNLLIGLITRREKEVNGHLLQTASALLVYALERQDRHLEAAVVNSYALANYRGSWNKRLKKQRSRLKKKLGVSYYLSDSDIFYIEVSGGLIFLFLLIYVVFGRREVVRRF